MMTEEQARALELARSLTLGASVLDYVSRDPARFSHFMAWACQAASAPPIAGREDALDASNHLAALARRVLKERVL